MATKHYSHLPRVHDALLSINVVTNTLTMEIYGTIERTDDVFPKLQYDLRFRVLRFQNVQSVM